MRKYSILMFFFLICFSSFCQNEILVFKNVTVVDVIKNKLIAAQTIVVKGNKILSISSKSVSPSNAVIIDAQGKYMIPGLWDMHTHSLRTGRGQYFFPLFIANGVTGIRDLGSDMDLEEINKLKADVAASKQTGPRLGAVTGRILDGRPRPDTLLFTFPADTAAAKKMVRTYKERKADFIKVYNLLKKDVYLAIISEAKKQGIAFAGHVPFSVTAAEASSFGQKSIEHLSDVHISVSGEEVQIRKELERPAAGIPSPVRRALANFKAVGSYDKKKATALYSAFVRNQTWQCPTLRASQIVSYGDINQLSKNEHLKYMPVSIKENWKRQLPARITGDSIQRAQLFQQSLNMVADMQRAGVMILAGTDVANPYLIPGFSLHEELELLVKAGLTPMQALQTATINPAKYFNKEKELGSIKKGKLADLVLLDENPLENIRNTRKIYAVIANGKLFQLQDIAALLRDVELQVKN